MLTTGEAAAVLRDGAAVPPQPTVDVVGSGGTVKVKMKEQLAGYHPASDGSSVAWPAAGDEVEVDDHEGAKLVAAGLAEPVKDAPVETAKLEEKSEKRATHHKV